MSLDDDVRVMQRQLREVTSRCERSERDLKCAMDVIGALTDHAFQHTQDRHDADMSRDDAPDVRAVVRAKKRLRQWLDACGINGNDVNETRRSENRLRPAALAG